MKIEDIEKAAVDNCVIDNSIYNDELQPYFMDGFKAGAEFVMGKLCSMPFNNIIEELVEYMNDKILRE